MAETPNVIRLEDLERYETFWALKPVPKLADLDALGRALGPREVGLAPYAWLGLRRDRWALLSPNDDTAPLLEAGGRPGRIQDALRVYRARGSHVVFATQRATLIFDVDVHEAEARRRLAAAGMVVLRSFDWMTNAFSVQIPNDQDPVAWTHACLDALGDVLREAMPELLLPFRPNACTLTYDDQWQLENTGQVSGTPGADIHAESAWEVTKGEGMRIAVIDFGFLPEHVDIQDDVLYGSGRFESSGVGGFLHGVSHLTPDTWDHGTSCAALAAGHPVPNRNLSGVAPKAKLLLLALDSWSSGEILGAAIRYAASQQLRWPGLALGWLRPFRGWDWRCQPMAHLISCSLATQASSAVGVESIQDALEYAARHGRGGRGTPVFWAAANATTAISNDFIAADPRTIVVGDTDRDDESAGHAYGPQLDFVAPGEYVVTARASSGVDGCGARFGTSFAAPVAAGVGALVLAVNPRLSADQMRTVMQQTCEKVGTTANYVAGHDEMYGYGRVNAACAVRAALVMKKMDLP